MRSDRTSLTGRAARTGRAGRRAFTLIELMVVIAIIAILAGLLMPAIGAALNKSHEARVLNMIHQCEIAATSFFNDHGDYPPSTWQDLFLANPFKTIDSATGRDVLDLNADGVVDVNDYNVFIGALGSTNNEGIDVFTSCLASRNGGPYLQPSDWQIRDTGISLPAIQGDTNWYFGTDHLRQLVDWWGNPLIYIHNRNYALTDGVTGGAGATWVTCVNTVTGETADAFSRSGYNFRAGTAPNLDSFQLFSLGLNGFQNPQLIQANAGTPFWMPHTFNFGAANEVNVVANPWTLRQMHFLANWEE